MELESYYNISQAGARLREIYGKRGGDAFFIVPSVRDREGARDLICGEDEPYFGATPCVCTIGDLYGRMPGVSLRVVAPPDDELILRCLTDKFLAKKKADNVKMAPGFSHGGFLSVLSDNIKDLIAEGVSFDLFDELLDARDYDETSPSSVLYELYFAYAEYLRKHALADASQIPSLAAEKLEYDATSDFVKGKTFVFIGFLSFTGSQLNFIRALDKRAEVVMFQPDSGGSFYDGVKQLKTEYKTRPEWDVPVVTLEAGNPHLEFEAVAREIALWKNNDGGFAELGPLDNYGEIGMTVAPSRLPVMEYALSRYKIAFNIQGTSVVKDTPLGDLPSLIWRAYTSGWSNYDAGILLSNPLVFSPYESSNAEYGGAAFPDNFEEWGSVLSEGARKRLSEVRALCGKLERGGTPVEILDMWRGFLEKCSAVTAAAKAARDASDLDQEVKNVSYALYEIKKKIQNFKDGAKDIGEAANVKLFGADALAFLNDWGSAATLPKQPPQSRSLTLYVGTPPIPAEHRYWIMTDADSNRWPGTLRESMLLSDADKTLLNASENREEYSYLPKLREQREQKEALFRRLVATGREGVVIARSLTDDGKDPVPPSQFTARLLSEEDAKRRWRLVKNISYNAEDALPNGASPWFPQVEILCDASQKAPEAVPPKGINAGSQKAEKLSVSMSKIDVWKLCPYKYWCEEIARFEAPQEELFDARAAGTLSHCVWEGAFAAKKENPKITIEGYVLKNWERLAHELYPALETDERLARRRAKIREETFNTAALLDQIEERAVRAGRIDVETERTIKDFEVGGVLFKGKIDRIDIYEEGVVLLDYKSGRSETHKNDWQAPAYCAALSASEGCNILGFGWVGMRGASFSGYFEDKGGVYYNVYAPKIKKKDPASLRVVKAEDVMEEMAKAVKEGVYSPKYDGKTAGSYLCKNCSFYVLCRKRETKQYIEAETEGDSSNGGESDE